MEIENTYPELRRCPHCGNPAYYRLSPITGYEYNGTGHLASIECKVCGASSPKIYLEDHEVEDDDYKKYPEDRSPSVRCAFARAKKEWNDRRDAECSQLIFFNLKTVYSVFDYMNGRIRKDEIPAPKDLKDKIFINNLLCIAENYCEDHGFKEIAGKLVKESEIKKVSTKNN